MKREVVLEKPLLDNPVDYAKVSVIILNWNGRDDTLECLASVSQLDYPAFEVIIVDNGSQDDSVSAIHSNFPGVIVLETGENLGFAGGNNVGMRYALKNGAEYVLLLNNDTVVDSQLLKHFISSSKLVGQEGIFGAKIYYYSEPNRIWYAGAIWVEELQHFLHAGQGRLDNGRDFCSIAETDYACGCALFASRQLLNSVGLFDEKFFLTFEETDLCYRARKVGCKSFVIPEAKVWHKISTSFGGEGSGIFSYYLMRNRLLWAEKNLPLRKRIVLYRKVLCELAKSMLPPRLRLIKSGKHSLRSRIRGSFSAYRCALREKFGSPGRKARLLGARDYMLRRFGSNCPASLRSTGKS